MSNKKCNLDKDCETGYSCAFNENDLNNYCVSNNINDLYYGCSDKNDFEIIETKSKDNTFDHLKCIDFSRKQTNQDGLEFNYMIYKPKKNVFVDTTTINIYLKCENEILAVIPYNDYFMIECHNNQQNCILKSKDSLSNFIIQNSKNCNKSIYLEIIYECENENLKKNLLVQINKNNINKININLDCPVDINNDKFKSKCGALYLDESAFDKDNINLNLPFNECKNPLFTVPRIISNINNYKKNKSIKSNNKILEYDNQINKKIEDLKILEAEKYIKLKEIQTGQTISIEDALKTINLNLEDKWKIFNNYDAAQNIFSEDLKDQILTYYGKVYTLKDAIDISSKNNQNYFVWYHNSYPLDNYASKLFFINIYFDKKDILDKKNWVKDENVTTGILKIHLEFISNNDDDDNEINNNEDLNKLKEIFEDSSQSKEYLQEKINNIITTTSTDNNNIYKNIINDLDNSITTYGQSISMNNYETTINNKILNILGYVILSMIILFVCVLVYFNQKTAGKIKLFS